MKKRQIAAVLAGIMAMSLAVPAMAADETEGEEVKLLIAAAASLEYSMEEKLIPLFEEQNPGVKVEGSYDSSGKLQTQIEEGMEADLFFSAATKQMDVFRQYGILQSDAYLESDLLPADFVDTYDMENDITARCQVSPRWLESADRDTKLEKIITQKWIAMFPEGCEAWAEQRRTGYPRLFQVLRGGSLGSKLTFSECVV